MPIFFLHSAACPAARACSALVLFATPLVTAAQPAPAAAGDTVLVTANPLRSGDAPPAAAVLSGDELVRRRAATLAETLDGVSGISSSWFGPAASRPVIRGQDGDRIRLLAGGGATLDASALSSDHAVAIDPLAVERIEVLRGPVALLYGGSAVGGVVNVIDNRIPVVPVRGLAGAGELRLGGAAGERTASALLEAGRDAWSLHADGYVRRTGDLAVPAFERDVDGVRVRRTTVVNSDSRSEGGAMGTSYAWRDGYAGLSVDSFRTRYGSVAEPDVRLDMARDRIAAAGEWRALPGLVETLRWQGSATDYRHDEIEGGAVGTTFRNRGAEGRLEAVHRAVTLGGGRLRGVFGLQLERSRFDALGSEAFVPSTHTRHRAAFVLETWTRGALALQLGGRTERVDVDSAGDAADADEPRFGTPQQRRYRPGQVSTGASWQISPGARVQATWASTSRAPSSAELYADGVHVATAAYERGDPTLGLERGRHGELAFEAASGRALSFKASVWTSRYARYIVLRGTGEVAEADGESLPVMALTGVRARLRGAELQVHGEVPVSALRVTWGLAADVVRGDDLDAGAPLPRLAPRRLRATLDVAHGPWRYGVAVVDAARQDRVPTDDTATPGWTRLDAGVSWSGTLGGQAVHATLQAGNLTDRLAYNASTIATVRGLAPLPGRSLRAALRLSF